MTRIGRVAAALSFPAALALTAGDASAQWSFCDRLQAEYRDLLRLGDGGGGRGRQLVNVDRLRQEMAEAQIAADRGNCQAIGFLFLRPRKSPQCPAIIAHLHQLSRELAQLRGGFELFNRSPEFERARLRDTLLRNGCEVPQYFGGGYRTVCVRRCDGYYFPISFATGQNRFQTDAEVCQSMYAEPGQAELFVYPTHGDVADAVSLGGERYGHQLYAFDYRSSYRPACATQLKEGIAALGRRYLAARQGQQRSQPATAILLPVPTARPTPSEDPETIANRLGDFQVRPLRSAGGYVAAADKRSIRILGAPYYAELFDVTKPPPRGDGPSFDLIGSARAQEPGTPAGTATPDEAPETTVQ